MPRKRKINYVSNVSVSVKAVKREKNNAQLLHGYICIFIRVSDLIHNHLRNLSVINTKVCL
jgi:hypothetical protein